MRLLSATLLVIVFMYSHLSADEIHLKNEEVLKGKIIQITSKRIEYDPVGKIPFRTVLKKMAKKIVYEGGRTYHIETKEKPSANDKEESKPFKLFETFKEKALDHGALHNKITIWGGMREHLYGYTDQRYAGCEGDDEDCEKDQGDYIKTDSQQFGLELLVSDFSDVYPDLKSGRTGFNIAANRRDKIRPRTLYAVPLHGIPEEIVPGDDAGLKKNQEWQWNIGIFIGIDKRICAFDFGITFLTTIESEEKRMAYGPDSTPENPTYVEREGRGFMFGDPRIQANALLRLGIEDKSHFILSFNRLDYDPIYGSLQSKFCFPIWEYLALNTGGYLWKTQSVFIEPVIKFAGASLGYKAGVIINFHDDEFEKASIKDSVFQSVSLSYEW